MLKNVLWADKKLFKVAQSFNKQNCKIYSAADSLEWVTSYAKIQLFFVETGVKINQK